jgi:hypothetical protein
VFRSVEPWKAVIDVEQLRTHAIAVERVDHVAIEGFRIKGLLGTSSRMAVFVSRVKDIVFANNVFDRRGRYGCSCHLFYATRSRDILVRDNVFQRPFYGLTTVLCKNVTVNHNTFWGGGGVTAIWMLSRLDDNIRITNNIFDNVIHTRKANAAVNIKCPTRNLVCDYNLYWRRESPKMGLFGFRTTRSGKTVYWGQGDARTIEELRERFGIGRHSRFGDPRLADPMKGDFRLKPGSPGIGMAADSGNAGARNPPSGLP